MTVATPPKYRWKIGKNSKYYGQKADIECIRENVECWLVFCYRQSAHQHNPNAPFSHKAWEFPLHIKHIKNGRLVRINRENSPSQVYLDSGVSGDWDWHESQLHFTLESAQQKAQNILEESIQEMRSLIQQMENQKEKFK